MRNIAFATGGLLAAAFTASIAMAHWTAPLALTLPTVAQNKNVTGSFSNAPASHVLDWLKKNGASFVYEEGSLPSGKRLTLNFKNQPMDKAVQAIAEALGMSATKNGQIYTFKSASTWGTYNKDWTPQEAQKWAREFQGDWKGFEGEQQFKWNGKAYELQNKPEMEKPWQSLRKMDHFQWDGKAYKLKEMDKGQMEKLWKELPKMEQFKWDGQEELSKQLLEKFKADQFEELGKLKEFEWKELPEGAFKELNKAQLEKLKADQFKELEGLKNFEWKEIPAEAFKELNKAQLEKLKADQFAELGKLKEFKEGTFNKIEAEALAKALETQKEALAKMKAGLGDLDKLLKSFTPAQLEKNKTQGYLKLSDLTEEQRKLLGDWGKGDNMSIQTDKDGTRITIKSK